MKQVLCSAIGEALIKIGSYMVATSQEPKAVKPSGPIKFGVGKGEFPINLSRDKEYKAAKVTAFHLLSAGHTSIKTLAWGVFGALAGDNVKWKTVNGLLKEWKQEWETQNG